MRNYLSVFILLSFAFLLYSCTKDKAAKPLPPLCNGTDSYNSKIKAILDVSCNQPVGACHDVTGGFAGVILDDYTNTKAAFTSLDIICNIQQGIGCEPMPQGGQNKLADSLITQIQCWAETNYPQ